ncbi:protein kinase [Candidatus Dependentiae bacterium]|nr:protein kinase [Candidatus Dependentiae bacterium]
MQINNKYEIVKKLEDCGFYNLLLAKNSVGKYFWIKVIKDDFAKNEEFINLIKNRIEQLNSLSIPLNVISEFGEFDKYFYLVETVKEIRSFQDFYDKLKNETLLIKVFLKVVDFLQHFHKKEIYFGLLNTSFLEMNQNLDIYFQDNFVDISNLDILKILSSSLASKRIVFIAPEVLGLEKLTEKSDVYSLGLMLAFILTGKLPFKPQNFFEFGPKAAAGVSESYIEEIPEKWRNFISAMISIDSSHRPTLTEVKKALSLVKAGQVKFCKVHPSRVAAEVCSRCGKELCSECIKLIRDSPFCKDCEETLDMHVTEFPGEPVKESDSTSEDVTEHFCEFHPKRHALKNPCPGCKKYFCSDCVEELEGIYYCANCYLEYKDRLEKKQFKLQQEESARREAELLKHKEEEQKQAVIDKQLKEQKHKELLTKIDEQRKLDEEKTQALETAPPSDKESKPSSDSVSEGPVSDLEIKKESVTISKKLLMYIGIAVIVVILFFVVSGMFSKGRTRKLEKQLREQIALYVTDISTGKYKGKEFDEVRLALANLYYEDERFDDYVKQLREIYDDRKANKEIRNQSYNKLRDYYIETDPELVEIFIILNDDNQSETRKDMARHELLARYIELSMYNDSIKMLDELISKAGVKIDQKLKYSRTLANIYKKKGDLKSGVKVMKAFLKSTPGSSEIRREARLALADYYRAIHWYKSAKIEYDVLVRHYYPKYTEGKLAYKAIVIMRREGKIK